MTTARLFLCGSRANRHDIAETVANALGGRKAGAGWMACCPAHDDRKPSLSIRDAGDGNVLVHCHAGCGQSAVIEALRGRGLWHDKGSRSAAHGRRQRKLVAPKAPEAVNRTRVALDLWSASEPAAGTPVEGYLRSRGLILAPPDILRFHPELKHPSGGVWPAMVALVEGGRDGEPIGIHRTFLDHDGAGKAPVTPVKMMLGPCRGGVAELAKAKTELMVGEGIETCLAAMQATGKPAWAALSTSGLCTLNLPDDVRAVTVLADGDDAGEKAAISCAARWTGQGKRVRIARPPRGFDFNDLLLGSCERNAQERVA